LLNDSVTDRVTATNITAARTLPGYPPTRYLVPYANISQLLALRARETPDKVFLIHYDQAGNREEISYADFDRRVAQYARLMGQEFGIQRGDRIATVGYNHSQIVLLYFAAWRLGAAVAPQNVAEEDQHIAFIINNAAAKVVFCFPEYLERVEAIRRDLARVERVVVMDDALFARVAATELAAQATEASSAEAVLRQAQGAVALEDEALLVYTSGTTGAPKGVVLTQYNMLVDAFGMSSWQGIAGNQRMMCVLPIHHVNGIIVTIITPLFVGGSTVLNRAYSPSHFWTRIAAEKVNVVSVVPTLLQFSCEYADAQAAKGQSIWGDGVTRADLAHFRHLICGAGTLALALAGRFEDQFGLPILHGYGLSETTCYSCFLPINLDETSHRHWLTAYDYPSIGCPILPNEMAIFSPDGSGERLGPGERGEICIRGHNVMIYYFQRPEANQETFKFGWFRSGDEGFYEVDGQGRHFFFITGRIKELINRGGVKFSPFDIEERLLELPGVKAGLAVAFPNDYYGEEIGVYIVLEEGSPLDEAAVIAHCRERLGFAKSPKAVVFGREIPVTSTGKYQRLKLRDLFAQWQRVQFRE
jgi:long-chain acyl-CoA synthetase